MLGEYTDDRSAFETVNHSYFAYIDIENINALYQKYRSKNVEILSEIADQPWGQRIAFYFMNNWLEDFVYISH